MRRRLIVTAMFILGLAFEARPADPADPIVRSWKLNLAKSSPQQKYVQFSETYRAINPGQIELTASTLSKDGASSRLVIVWPAQGGAATVLQGDTDGQNWVQTRVKPGEWYATYMRDGKQTGYRHKVISKDGKTMRHTTQFMDAQGKPIDGVQVFDRQ